MQPWANCGLGRRDARACSWAGTVRRSRVEQRQLAYLLARQQVRFPTGNDELDEVMNNTRLAEQFEVLAKELDVLEPKTAEDVYKSQLEQRTCAWTAHALGPAPSLADPPPHTALSFWLTQGRPCLAAPRPIRPRPTWPSAL